jgi:long-subunit fatty acid transport protein
LTNFSLYDQKVIEQMFITAPRRRSTIDSAQPDVAGTHADAPCTGPGPGLAAPRFLAVPAALCLLLTLLFAPHDARASGLLAPAAGAADSGTAGTRVADPHTPSAALFSNPAGLTGFDSITLGGSLGLGYGWTRIVASQPAGYRETNEFVMGIPDFGVSIPFDDRWHFALGAYGTTGSTFEFEGDPRFGVPEFFSETILAAVPIGVAYRLTDRLSIGAQIEPLYGQLRTHFPLNDLEFRYKINGAGVQGMVGTSFRLSEQWAFGLSVRTPGRIWMDGSMPIQGIGRQDVDVDLEMPTQVFLGATWRCTPRLTLSGSIRFTDSSRLGDSEIEYELTPQANIGFIPDGKDEWKFALGAEYALHELWRLRFGAMYGSRIVGSQGVTPLVFDTEDIRLTIGAGRTFGNLVVDVTAGYAVPMQRTIAPQAALLIPGEYKMRGAVFLLGFTYRFPPADSRGRPTYNRP